MQGSVTVHMNASPEEIWALISDVTLIGHYSPETFEAKWLDGATGPAAGVKFKGHVKRNGKGPIYWTTCTIRDCEEPRRFSFGVGSSDHPLNVWSYDLEGKDGGTNVTESFQLTPAFGLRMYWALFGWLRGPANERGMRTTLERIKEHVEGADRPEKAGD